MTELPPPSASAHCSLGPSTRQVLLGLFIVGQICFLFTSNAIRFLQHFASALRDDSRQVGEQIAPGFPREQGHVWALLDSVSKSNHLWAQATGQLQDWSLFAPSVAANCVFPALELRWDEWAPELFLSDNEPADVEDYFRLGFFRMRRMESNLVITLKAYPHETEPEKLERWREKIHAHIRDYGGMIHAYVRWRLPQVMARLPGRKDPQQIIVWFRRYHIVEPEQAPPFWEGPDAVLVARCVRGQSAVGGSAAGSKNYQPMEWYNPVTKRFEGMAQ